MRSGPTAPSTSRCSRSGASMPRTSRVRAPMRAGRGRPLWRAPGRWWTTGRGDRRGGDPLRPAGHGAHAQRDRPGLHHRSHRRSAPGCRHDGRPARHRRVPGARPPSRRPPLARRPPPGGGAGECGAHHRACGRRRRHLGGQRQPVRAERPLAPPLRPRDGPARADGGAGLGDRAERHHGAMRSPCAPRSPSSPGSCYPTRGGLVRIRLCGYATSPPASPGSTCYPTRLRARIRPA